MNRSMASALGVLLLVAVSMPGGLSSAMAQRPGHSESAPGDAVQLSGPPQAFRDGEFVPGELLVKFRVDAGARSVDGAPARYNATDVRTLSGLDVHLWLVPDGRELEIIARLAADPLVEYAEPNGIYRALSTPNDPYYGRQWAHAIMQSAAAWDLSTGSSSVIIGVLDTGIDENHPDLASKIVAGYDFVSDDADPHDLNGHGTALAGIAAAGTNNGIGVAGMDWQARIMPIRVLNAQGSGTWSDFAEGVSWAAGHGADVLNVGLGGTAYSQTVQNAINSAHAAGVLIVAAMGQCRTAGPNCPVANPTTYPAAMDNVMAVAATGPTDTYAYYSPYGPHCDIAAPGGSMVSMHDPGGIYTTLPTYTSFYLHTHYGYSTEYDYLQGTSMATAYVAGLAALVWSVSPALTPDEVQRTIEGTAVDLGAPGKDADYGWGRVDARAALQAARPVPPAPKLDPIDNPDMDGDYLVNWNDVPGATSYTLQEANNPDFAPLSERYRGPNSQYPITGQGQGTWYYRVFATNAAGSSLPSNTEWTTVITPPPAPTLNPITNPTNSDAYQVTWSAVAGATGYRLQEANSPSFADALVRYEGSSTQYQVTGQPNGTWYYRVLAYNSAGASPWSASRSSTVSVVALPEPVLNPIDNPDGDGRYDVTWSTVSDATSYTLEQSGSVYFEAATGVYSGAGNGYAATNQPGGKWYYRVRAFGSGGARSPWSDSQSVRVRAGLCLPLLARDLFFDPYEPNDRPAQAWGPLVSGQTYRAYFPNEADNDDWYYVLLPAGQTIIEIWLTEIPVGNDHSISLYDEQLHYPPLGYSNEWGNADEHILKSGLASGLYYIGVHRWEGTSRAQPYALRAVLR